MRQTLQLAIVFLNRKFFYPLLWPKNNITHYSYHKEFHPNPVKNAVTSTHLHNNLQMSWWADAASSILIFVLLQYIIQHTIHLWMNTDKSIFSDFVTNAIDKTPNTLCRIINFQICNDVLNLTSMLDSYHQGKFI